jgi:tRNA-dihydrouridine synthase A
MLLSQWGADMQVESLLLVKTPLLCYFCPHYFPVIILCVDFMVQSINRKISVAPMMDYTDRHFRYLTRLISKNILLYTEMVTAQSIVLGDSNRLLRRSVTDGNVSLQLGGSDPKLLVQAALAAQPYGYGEINLNVGCPSSRVQSGRIGACLMKEPSVVAECVSALQNAVQVPVTVKTRLGIDHDESYEFLREFINRVSETGCSSFTIHARKAWLKGLSPKQNRTVPPLNYERVYQLKEDYPHLEVIMNGGIANTSAVQTHLQYVDGVMIGREAYRNVFWLDELERTFLDAAKPRLNRQEIFLTYLDYVEAVVSEERCSLQQLIKHALGLFSGIHGVRAFRNDICVYAREGVAGIGKIRALSERLL